MAAEGDWASLPSVVLQDIFSKLQLKDRLNASSTCHKWREYLFMARFWNALTFKLTRRRDRERSHFLISRCGKFAKEVRIQFDSSKSFQVWDCTRLLENLSRYGQLECLSLKPSSCYFDDSDNSFQSFVEALQTLVTRSKHIIHLSLGCTEILLKRSSELLQLLLKFHSQYLQSLHLPSVKDNPTSYRTPSLPLELIPSTICLHSLSLDYDFVTSKLLTCLAHRTPNAPALKNLCVHIHRIGPQKLTDPMWKQVKMRNPQFELTINLVHSYEGVSGLLDILKPSMPLVHLKQYFCGDVNVAALNFVSHQYASTFRSLSIVEAIEHQPIEYAIPGVEDPFVMMAWRCRKLQSLKLIGLSLDQNNLVAVARLRIHLRLVVPRCCVFWNEEDEEYNDENDAMFDFQSKISSGLSCQWAFLPESKIPLAVFYANADADEAYMDDLLQDQAWRGIL